jgi:hypothetical protein
MQHEARQKPNNDIVHIMWCKPRWENERDCIAIQPWRLSAHSNGRICRQHEDSPCPHTIEPPQRTFCVIAHRRTSLRHLTSGKEIFHAEAFDGTWMSVGDKAASVRPMVISLRCQLIARLPYQRGEKGVYCPGRVACGEGTRDNKIYWQLSSSMHFHHFRTSPQALQPL